MVQTNVVFLNKDTLGDVRLEYAANPLKWRKKGSRKVKKVR